MSACLVLAGVVVAGCSKQQEASREQGKAAAEAIKAPIERARQVDLQQQQAAEEARKKMDAQTN